jgi:hypothetical protein
LGVIGPLVTGRQTRGLGFINHGGTLNIESLLFVNRCTWAHCVDAAASLLRAPREALLSEDELAAIDHQRSPHGAVIPERPMPPSAPREISYAQITRRLLESRRTPS